jgi:hypothetical protein
MTDADSSSQSCSIFAVYPDVDTHCADHRCSEERALKQPIHYYHSRWELDLYSQIVSIMVRLCPVSSTHRRCPVVERFFF